MVGIHVDIVVIMVGGAGSACLSVSVYLVLVGHCCTRVTVRLILVSRRIEALRSLRLSGLLNSRQSYSRTLAERKVGLKQTIIDSVKTLDTVGYVCCINSVADAQ